MKQGGLTAAVFGATGLAGGELLRLLLQHPKVETVIPLSRTESGKSAASVHPALRHLPEVRFSDKPPMETAAKADVVFLALPHGQSCSLMPELVEKAQGKIIDLAADFRIEDKDAYEKHYGAHPSFDLVSSFVYGLPEAFAEKIRTARRIANPGCFATAAELLLLPLAKEGLLKGAPCPVFAVTGSTGSGKNPKPTTHHPFRDGNFFAYKMLSHQHQPEVEQALSAASKGSCRIRLLSHSGPFVRGIHACTFLSAAGFESEDVAGLYKKAYADSPFVHVLDEPPKLAEIVGTNFVHIGIAQKSGEIEVALALDNLVKGAAGQAVQNMNLMLGIDETAGLTFSGAYPC